MYHVIGSTHGRALRVLWCLEELGLPFSHHAVAGPDDPQTPPDPSGRPPVLVCEGISLADSTAILTFLADRHQRLTHPPGTLLRARQDSLVQYLLDAFDSPLWLPARHGHLLPEALRRSSVTDPLMREFVASQKALLPVLEPGPFLMGDMLTIPDIICGQCGLWADVAGFPISEPRLAEYLARLHARPALKRALAR